MTCIVGFTDKEKGITYMGCDSCVSNSFSKAIYNQRKVFKLKDTNNALMGFTGNVRDLNLLKYAKGLIDKRDEPNINEEYIVTKVIPQVIRTIDNGSRCYTNNGQKDMDSAFLLCYKDKLWQIGSDFSVASIRNDYMTAGSGKYLALGSLYSTEKSKLSITDRIHIALQSASNFVMSVTPPFYIFNTENDEIIEFEK